MRRAVVPDVKKMRRTAALAGGTAVLMVGMSYAAVPLYDLFCRVTGFGGTTQYADAAPEVVSDQTIKVRFNADTNSKLPWNFQPSQGVMEVKLGEGGLAFYEAQNMSQIAREGVAVYNVTPQKAGKYFNKIACFCFDSQVLEPGQRVDMPVTFFVDPAIYDNPNTRDVKTITLSYTFFPADDIDESKEPKEVAVLENGDGVVSNASTMTSREPAQ